MEQQKRLITIVRILLTIGVFEFFGPIVRDTNASHLLNPEWVGHSRFHLMWQLGTMFFAGICNLYFIWKRDSVNGLRNLYVAVVWQATNILGFWSSVLLVNQYDGLVFDAKVHIKIIGLVDENVFVFSILSVLLSIIISLLYKLSKITPSK